MVAAPSAHAAFPGANGKINFVSYPGGARFMNPDGSAQTPAAVYGIWSPDAGHVLQGCNNAVCVFRADGTFEQENYHAASVNGFGWSPDGTKFAYAEQVCYASYCDPEKIYHQGFPSGPTAEVTAQDDLEPAWSPDGTRIAFVTFRHDRRQLYFDGPPGPAGSTELYVSNVDGTGQLRLTNSPGNEGGPTRTGVDDYVDGDALPSWSPDGTKIAVASNRDGNWEIYVVNADGSGSQRLTNNPATDVVPRWSPDGTKIAFQTNRDGNQEIYSMNPDGSGQTNLTNNPATDILYDWLSIPINSYPRPKGATPFKTYLVPAFKQCTAANRTHGAPLAFPSCSLPQQTSSYLTVGTPDSNGLAPTSRGSVQYTAVVGNSSPPANEADLRIDVDILGVLNKSDRTPYTGQLSADAGLRITDRNNTPSPGGPGAATVQDGSFPVTVPCTAAHCAVATAANAVVPGSVVKGQRAIWQLGEVQVYDAGADGLASTTGDNTLFMDQGIFTP